MQDSGPTVITKSQRLLLYDICIILLIYITPAISHVLNFPLYQLDPMRWGVLCSLLRLKSKKNALILAASLPLLSYLTTGHPIIIKNAIIAVELCTNLFLFII